MACVSHMDWGVWEGGEGEGFGLYIHQTMSMYYFKLCSIHTINT